MTVSEVQKSITNWVMDAEYKISTQEQRELDASGKVEHSRLALENKESQLNTANVMLETVLESIKKCKKETREVGENLKALPADVKQADEGRADVEEKTEEFEKAMENFEWLKKRTEIEQPDEDVDMEEGGLYEGEMCTDLFIQTKLSTI